MAGGGGLVYGIAQQLRRSSRAHQANIWWSFATVIMKSPENGSTTMQILTIRKLFGLGTFPAPTCNLCWIILRIEPCGFSTWAIISLGSQPILGGGPSPRQIWSHF